MFNMLLCSAIVEPLIEAEEKIYAIDAIMPYAKWATVIIVAVMLGAGLVFAFTAKDFLKKYLKYALSFLIIYALAVGIIMLILDIVKHYDPAYLEENYVNADVATHVLIPLLVTLSITLVGAIVLTVIGKKRDRDSSPWYKKVVIAVGAVIGAAVVTTLALMLIYYMNNISGDGYYTAEGAKFNEVALYVGAAVLTAGAIVAAIIVDKTPLLFDAKMIARGGICIALAFAFSYVKLFKLPQGGTVTLAATLPIMLFAFAYGPKKGLLIGFIYGLLQAVQDPFIIHPAQFLLDYPIAFTMIGFAGVLAKTKMPVQVKFALGAVIASVLRFIAHVISGVFAFGAYAADAGADNFLLYSLAYNSFVFVDIAIAIVLGVLLISNKAVRKIVLGQTFEKEPEKASVTPSEDALPTATESMTNLTKCNHCGCLYEGPECPHCGAPKKE